jgi:hypothetical protein
VNGTSIWHSGGGRFGSALIEEWVDFVCAIGNVNFFMSSWKPGTWDSRLIFRYTGRVPQEISTRPFHRIGIKREGGRDFWARRSRSSKSNRWLLRRCIPEYIVISSRFSRTFCVSEAQESKRLWIVSPQVDDSAVEKQKLQGLLMASNIS